MKSKIPKINPRQKKLMESLGFALHTGWYKPAVDMIDLVYWVRGDILVLLKHKENPSFKEAVDKIIRQSYYHGARRLRKESDVSMDDFMERNKKRYLGDK